MNEAANILRALKPTHRNQTEMLLHPSTHEIQKHLLRTIHELCVILKKPEFIHSFTTLPWGGNSAVGLT